LAATGSSQRAAAADHAPSVGHFLGERPVAVDLDDLDLG